jgi:hypothetical protein
LNRHGGGSRHARLNCKSAYVRSAPPTGVALCQIAARRLPNDGRPAFPQVMLLSDMHEPSHSRDRLSGLVQRPDPRALR